MNRTTKQLLLDAPDVLIPHEQISETEAYRLNSKQRLDYKNFQDNCFKTQDEKYVRLNDDELERELDDIRLQIQLSMLSRINTIKNVCLLLATLAVIGFLITLLAFFA